VRERNEASEKKTTHTDEGADVISDRPPAGAGRNRAGGKTENTAKSNGKTKNGTGSTNDKARTTIHSEAIAIAASKQRQSEQRGPNTHAKQQKSDPLA
jgi:hypothetical protein